MGSSHPEEGMTPSVQEKFRALQRHYVKGLGARWTEICSLQDSAADLQQALHRLCGSAATYGFDALDRCARTAEQLSVKGPSDSLNEALKLLRREMDAVEREFE